jgi:hypothetical protein
MKLQILLEGGSSTLQFLGTLLDRMNNGVIAGYPFFDTVENMGLWRQKPQQLY